MRQLLKSLFRDENGMIVSSEIVLVGTILVLGTVVGLASLSYAVNNELNDVAQACDRVYTYPGSVNPPQDYSLTSSTGVPEVVGTGR